MWPLSPLTGLGLFPSKWPNKKWLSKFQVILTVQRPVGGDPPSTLPETNSSALKIGRKPNRKGSYSNHQFLGAFAVSFREGIYNPQQDLDGSPPITPWPCATWISFHMQKWRHWRLQREIPTGLADANPHLVITKLCTCFGGLNSWTCGMDGVTSSLSNF